MAGRAGGRTPSSARRRVLARLGAAGLAAVLALTGAPPAAANGGTWGVNQAQYSDGIVCRNGPITAPLAAWDFGDGSPDFLLQEVTSNGITDSAQLPQADAPGRSNAALLAGEYGFSDADIATYAALLSRYGARHGAAVARAVLERSDPGNVPNCGSAADAGSLIAAAARQAGPYQLSVSAAHRPVVLEQANAVTVQVTAASGGPAAGVSVELDASEPVFGTSTTTTVTTGATGTATAAFTAPAALGDERLTIVANAQVSVGLEAVTVDAQFGTGGRYVPAVYADPPETYSARTTLPIDQTADPQVSTTLPSRGVTTQASVPLAAEVSGMRGHDGEGRITVTGPAPLNPHSLCADLAGDAHLGTAYQTGTLDVQGDGRLDGAEWVPDKPGCYQVTAEVATTDATPQASAHSPPVVLTVLDTAGTIATTKDVIGPGAIGAKLTLKHSYGMHGTASVTVRGPLRPGDADCSGRNWSHAGRASGVTRAISGDGTYSASSGRLSTPGCYQLQGSVHLALPGGGVANIPVQPEGDAGVIYLLHPSVTLTGDATSAVSPAAVGAHVLVTGTFGQHGHLRVSMVHAPGGTYGCAAVDYAHGTAVAHGPSVPISGDGTFAVKSGPTPKNGCYTLVPVLVMDANTAVVATGTAGAPGSTLVAGLDQGGTLDAPVSAADGGALFSASVWTAILVYLAVAGAATLFVLRLVREDGGKRPLPGLDQLLD